MSYRLKADQHHWGFLIWREIPTWLTLAGAALTLGSGLYVLYRERKERGD